MKRILCMLLALCCILPLAACNGARGDQQSTESTRHSTEATPPSESDSEGTTAPQESEETTTPQDLEESTAPQESDETTTPEESDVTTDPVEPPDDPEVKIDPVTGEAIVNLEGYQYNAYVLLNTGSGAFYTEDFWVEGASKDALSYAVYARNKTIEETYNCKIRQFDSDGDQHNEMTRFYLNDEKYELAILLGASAARCSTTNLLQNLLGIENIRLDHAAYDQNAIADFNVYGKLYYISGDMNISTLDSAAVTIFNPDLFAKYDFVELCENENYDNLYEMVADGTWTVSAMLEMAEQVNVDENKNGIIAPEKDPDTLGYFSYSASPIYYWYSCGARISATDKESGEISLVFGSEDGNSKELFDFLYEKLNNKKEGNEWIQNGGGGTRNQTFMTDQLLFTDIILWDVRKVLQPQDKADYGILPTPKYNESQSRYYDFVYWPYGTTHLWSIPVMCESNDKAGFMFHLMAQYSAAPDGTMAGYFNKTLCKTFYRESTAYDVLNTVKGSLTYDYFLLYDWGNFIQRLIEGIDTSDGNLYEETVTEKNLENAIKDMNITLEKFKNPTTIEKTPAEPDPEATE